MARRRTTCFSVPTFRLRLIFSCEHLTRRVPTVHPILFAISRSLNPSPTSTGISAGSVLLFRTTHSSGGFLPLLLATHSLSLLAAFVAQLMKVVTLRQFIESYTPWPIAAKLRA